jgi:YidC/Oxa1 family membrane protein insertase
MDSIGNIRVFLWVTLLALIWLAYTAWVRDYGSAPPAPPSTAPLSVPAQDLPPVEGAPAQTTPPAPVSAAAPPTETVRVRTDVLDVLINLRGGDLVRADLLQYPVDKHSPDNVVRLLDYEPGSLWGLQSGLRGTSGTADPNHLSTFRSASTEYVLAPGQNELVVPLEWTGEGPLSARKTYTFRRGQYAVDLALSAVASGAMWRGYPYVRMVRLHNPVERSYTSVDSYSFTGPLLYDGDQYEKLDVEDLAETPIEQKVTGGWLAAIQHHFVAAAVPPLTDPIDYQASARGQEFLLSAIGSLTDVTAAMPLDYHVTLFVGPKLQDQLKAAGPELDRTVDYGVLSVLSKPMFLVLSFIERWVNNWGWAIVLMTVLIKLAFYKLTAMSGRSMAKMRKLAPRMKSLQERHKDDRQALSQAMMDLYKREKVNPAAGCVPILIQMPFFFAFYWVLIESVEMRQAPFMLWIDDLSARDPFFVLPLLMGAAMYFQTKMSPAPPDPMQARVMQIMPVIFTGFFLLFPAGLVLYWLTNTALSILQQWRINKVVEAESATSAASS